MSDPVSSFSKLSLESMPPPPPPSFAASSAFTSEYQANASRPDVSYDNEEEKSPRVVESPATRLSYYVDHLSSEAQSAVRDVFSEPPKIALQMCRLIHKTYVFQMTELATRSIRICAPNEGGISQLRCSCGKADDGPCKHLLWLLDHISDQTLYNLDRSKPLKMTSRGWTEELGDPFQRIADYRLDILADSMRCTLVDSQVESDPDDDDDDDDDDEDSDEDAESNHGVVDSSRAQEAHELLALSSNKPVEEFRPDLLVNFSAGGKILKRGDLEHTVFQMLLHNDHFFHYFLSQARSANLYNDTFRRLFRRVDQVMQSLDRYVTSVATSITTSTTSSSYSAEAPPNVSWAASHLLGLVRTVKRKIFTRDRPLESGEATMAAHTLIHVLDVVMAWNYDAHPGSTRLDRNLYLRLIGDRDDDFVIGVLITIPEAASQFLSDLEGILDQTEIHGAPASYVERFRSLLRRLRASSVGSGLKRQGPESNADPRRKRFKSSSPFEAT